MRTAHRADTLATRIDAQLVGSGLPWTIQDLARRWPARRWKFVDALHPALDGSSKIFVRINDGRLGVKALLTSAPSSNFFSFEAPVRAGLVDRAHNQRGIRLFRRGRRLQHTGKKRGEVRQRSARRIRRFGWSIGLVKRWCFRCRSRQRGYRRNLFGRRCGSSGRLGGRWRGWDGWNRNRGQRGGNDGGRWDER